MNVGSITNSLTNGLTKVAEQDNNVNSGDSFAKVLKNAMGELIQSQVDGYSAMEGIATGSVKNLQEAVQKMEEAELSLKLALEVKNKALSAYKEVMRMQV